MPRSLRHAAPVLAAIGFLVILGTTLLARSTVEVATSRIVLDDDLDRLRDLRDVSFPARAALTVDLASSQPVLSRAAASVGLDRSGLTLASLATAETAGAATKADVEDRPLVVVAATGGRSAPIVEVTVAAEDATLAGRLARAVADQTAAATRESSVGNSGGTPGTTSDDSGFRVLVLGPSSVSDVAQGRGILSSVVFALLVGVLLFAVVSLVVQRLAISRPTAVAR